MKLNSINNYRAINNNNNNNNNNSTNNNRKNVPFKGIANNLAAFWQMVDNGGRAAQFTVEDMTGTNFPRSIKGAMAGYKYTGKINIPAFLQEAIREFLTGPTMCVTPVVILATAKKLCGKSANIKVENIENFSDIMLNVKTGAKGDVEKEFFNNVSSDLLKNTIGEGVQVPQEAIDEISAGLENYHKIVTTPKTKAKGLFKKSPEKQQAAEALSGLQSSFESIVKKLKPNYSNTDFLNAKYTLKNSSQGQTKFKNYADYASSYIEDFTRKNTADSIVNISPRTIGQFKKSLVGNRIMVIAAMFGITGFLMSFIPKLYTLASGGVNPNASAIYNEADKKNSTTNEKEAK